MFLSGATLKDTIENCVQDYQEDHLGQVSYDLRVQEIIDPFTRKQYDRYDLRPGETVFIGSQEIVTIPNDCVGMIHLRNSVIRMGVSYESPVYQPGHQTRIFTRIKNESPYVVSIKQGDSMVSFMLEKLDQEAASYQGVYQDQFTFTDQKKKAHIKTPKVMKIYTYLQYGTLLALTSLSLALLMKNKND
ncbi:dCTP deaminase domain-containing protein [Intestinibaculum porci]|uniref:dCTP deaminase domain-containing protein n=1 Tax=Intestinibaculum porci TaxID=2487118 RepID=UPI0024095103|nr:hypothetical protein [Intestinibaculum porci]MDD6348657.1 hypothetical protein [Intestinibaculum porci]MDD6422284.1 hypothetical protein [Intestinibaculum porci]